MTRADLIDKLASATFPHLPTSTAKEAQSSWRLARKIAADTLAEIERIATTRTGARG